MKMRHGTSARNVVNLFTQRRRDTCQRNRDRGYTETAVTRRPHLHGDVSYMETAVIRRPKLHEELSYTETSVIWRPQLHGDLNFTETSVTRRPQLRGDLSYTATKAYKVANCSELEHRIAHTIMF